MHIKKNGKKRKENVVLLPSHCCAEPKTFDYFSLQYNRLDLVQHCSSTAVARRMSWVLYVPWVIIFN